MQAGRPAQPSATNSPSSSHPSLRASHRDAPSKLLRHAAARVAPYEGDLGRLNIPAAGERPPRARPWRRGSPGPVPNPAVKPAVAESTAEEVRGRLGSRARGGRLSYAREMPRARGTARERREARRGDRPLRASSRFATAAGMRPRPRMHDAPGAFLVSWGGSAAGRWAV